MPTQQMITVAYDHMFPENLDPRLDRASAEWLYESRWSSARQLATKWEREGVPHPLPIPSRNRRPVSTVAPR